MMEGYVDEVAVQPGCWDCPVVSPSKAGAPLLAGALLVVSFFLHSLRVTHL